MFCDVLCTTVGHNDTHTIQFTKLSVCLGLVFLRLFRFSMLCVFLVWLIDYFVLVLSTFDVLVSSVLRQEIG